MIEDIILRLQKLRQEGIQIITPEFAVLFNPFQNEFILDIPDCKKEIAIKDTKSDTIYQWDTSSLYPIKVSYRGCYKQVWNVLEPYTQGASLELLPTDFIEDGREYVWFEDYEKGGVALCKDEMMIINFD